MIANICQDNMNGHFITDFNGLVRRADGDGVLRGTVACCNDGAGDGRYYGGYEDGNS